MVTLISSEWLAYQNQRDRIQVSKVSLEALRVLADDNKAAWKIQNDDPWFIYKLSDTIVDLKDHVYTEAQQLILNMHGVMK